MASLQFASAAARAVRPRASSRLVSLARPLPRSGVPLRPLHCLIPTGTRSVSSTSNRRLIVPDSKGKEPAEVPEEPKAPADISDSEYHRVADLYLDRVLGHLEKIQDEKGDVDVEYSNGVMTVTLGLEGGTYVINKQPPNKQIWISSPKTGPKRYDYVILQGGQQDKQDTEDGEWIYLRDNSSLTDLFLEEMGIDVSVPVGHFDA